MRNQIIRAIAALSLIACTEPEAMEPEPMAEACSAITVYKGPTVSCDYYWPREGTPGLCVSHFGAPAECVPTCDAPCLPGWWPQSIAVSDGPPACYCYPAPSAHVVGDLWPDDARDHRER